MYILYNLYFIEPYIFNIFNIISKNYFILLNFNREFRYTITPLYLICSSWFEFLIVVIQNCEMQNLTINNNL